MKTTSLSCLCAIAFAWFNIYTTAHAAVGATTPFTSYEGEAGTLGGGATVVALTSPPTSQFSSPTLEASGHAYVQLTATGQYVQWVNNTGQNITALNLRASIPDSSSGTGMTATLNLYVNGVFRQTLTLSSQQSWGYEGNNHYNNDSQNPADGNPRDFFDDMHTFITGAAIAPGSTIRLQRDSSNTAAFYYIDVIDLENPPAAASQPANSISITSSPYNAVANNSSVDNTTAIQNCINAAQTQGKIVWIPQGTFYVRGGTSGGAAGLHMTGITMQGAGPWSSDIYRNLQIPLVGYGAEGTLNVDSGTVRDLFIDSNGLDRNGTDGGIGAIGIFGSNWSLNNVWIQHVTAGVWAAGTNGTVQNCRVTSAFADGINLNNFSGTSTVAQNLTATNNFVRGTGDDALAINGTDSSGHTPMNIITLSNNTTVAPWGGKNTSVYGGHNLTLQNNLYTDSPRYPGIGFGYFSQSASIVTAMVQGNTLLRCGGNYANDMTAAIEIGTDNTSFTDTGITFQNNTINNPLFGGVTIKYCSTFLFSGNTIARPSSYGISVEPGAIGNGSFINNSVVNLGSGQTAFVNNSTSYTPILSGNSWQGGVGPQKGVVYHLVCQTSGMALDNGGSTTSGTTVTQWTDNTGNANQEWKLVDLGNGYFNLVCQKSGMALDNGGSTNDGTTVRQLTIGSGNNNQEWKFVSVGGGYYHLICLTSGKALDNTGSTTAGTSVTQWADGGVGNPNQNWKLELVPKSGSVYHFVSGKSGMAMDNAGSTTAGTAVTQWTDNTGNNNQEWKLVDVGSGNFNLVCQKSSMALDNGGSTTAGTTVKQNTVSSGNTNQYWQLVSLGGGAYNVICQKSGMALDNNGSTTTGTTVIQNPIGSGNANQYWTLEFVR